MPSVSPRPDARVTRFGLYARLGFGAAVMFGIVGSIAGYRTGSTLIFIMTATCWALTRIVVEAIDAYKILSTSPPAPPKDKPPVVPTAA